MKSRKGDIPSSTWSITSLIPHVQILGIRISNNNATQTHFVNHPSVEVDWLALPYRCCYRVRGPGTERHHHKDIIRVGKKT